MVALLVLVTVLTFIAMDYGFRRREAGVSATRSSRARPKLVELIAPVYRTPGGVFFEPGHTWSYLEENGGARLGIDDFARNVIGTVEEFETVSEGEKVSKGDVILRIRQGRHDVSFKAPFDGIVDAVNTELMSQGELRGIEPYTDAWLYRIRPANPEGFARGMMLGAEATRWLGREVDRFKVFLSTIIPRHPVLGETMQDGGMPISGLAEHLDDVEWKKLKDTFFV